MSRLYKNFHHGLWVIAAFASFMAGLINAGNADMASRQAIINFIVNPVTHKAQSLKFLTNVEVKDKV